MKHAVMPQMKKLMFAVVAIAMLAGCSAKITAKGDAPDLPLVETPFKASVLMFSEGDKFVPNTVEIKDPSRDQWEKVFDIVPSEDAAIAMIEKEGEMPIFEGCNLNSLKGDVFLESYDKAGSYIEAKKMEPAQAFMMSKDKSYKVRATLTGASGCTHILAHLYFKKIAIDEVPSENTPEQPIQPTPPVEENPVTVEPSGLLNLGQYQSWNITNPKTDEYQKVFMYKSSSDIRVYYAGHSVTKTGCSNWPSFGYTLEEYDSQGVIVSSVNLKSVYEAPMKANVQYGVRITAKGISACSGVNLYFQIQ